MSRERSSARSTSDRSPAGAGESQSGGGLTQWASQSVLRLGLGLVGVVILLVAVGELVGLNLLSWVVEALSTPAGWWIAVGVVALVLILVAVRGFGVATR